MTQPVLSELPRSRQFSRIERLSLPMPEQRFVKCEECRRHSHPAVALEDETSLPARLRAPTGEAGIALFRWMLGHHVAICSWRMLADRLEAGLLHPWQGWERLEDEAFLLDVYASMLTYAGSCTPEVYASVIRPRMMKTSRSFSGTWARDYERVQHLVRQVCPDSRCPFDLAYRRMSAIHRLQAKRLVPGGVSLLKAAGSHAVPRTSELERGLFDRFFLIERKPRCRWSFRAQLVRRISQILCDLRRHPLTGAGYAEPAADSALSCEATLRRLAETVTGGIQ